MALEDRVLARYLEAYKRPDNMVPVMNKDKGRIVYVLPDTLKEETSTYEKLPASKLNSEGKPAPLRHPGQPRLPKKPEKPKKPEIPREPPPAPIHPPIPPYSPLPPKKPKPVKPVKPVKVTKPSPPRKYKKVRRFLADSELEIRVVSRFLEKVVAA